MDSMERPAGLASDAADSDRDFSLPQGRLRGRIIGPDAGPMAMLVPGATMNLVSQERIAAALADAGWRSVALDLRGRGYSETTPPGTYGWERHARDLIDLADLLQAQRFAVVGHSSGAYVAQQVGAMAPDRVSNLALIDLADRPAPEVSTLVRAGVARLRNVHPSAEAYLQQVRSRGTVTPWEEIWERHYRYEQVEVEGGVRTRTSYDAVLEDVAYGEDHDATALWPDLRCPVLLVRATLPYLPSTPNMFDVPPASVPAFLAGVSGASVVEIEANHYGVLISPGTAVAVVESFQDAR